MKLKSHFSLLLFITIGLLASGAWADVKELMREAKCYACHDTETTLIGPPYKAIALRHRQQKIVALDVLTQKIINGGGGNWGQVPMVPNEQLSEAEARAMAQWILSLP